MPPFYWFLLFLGIVLSSLGGIFLKMGSVQMNYESGLYQIIFSLLKNWQLILGLIFYFIPAMLWIYMLNKVEISFLQPLFSLAYVLTPLLACFIFQESISTVRWIGIIIIVFGVSVVARG